MFSQNLLEFTEIQVHGIDFTILSLYEYFVKSGAFIG